MSSRRFFVLPPAFPPLLSADGAKMLAFQAEKLVHRHGAHELLTAVVFTLICYGYGGGL